MDVPVRAAGNPCSSIVGRIQDHDAGLDGLGHAIRAYRTRLQRTLQIVRGRGVSNGCRGLDVVSLLTGQGDRS